MAFADRDAPELATRLAHVPMFKGLPAEVLARIVTLAEPKALEVERAHLRQRHVHGDEQVDAL